MVATIDELLHALTRAVNALAATDIKFAVAGGCAVYARGGPASQHDVDIFVKPQDCAKAVRALARLRRALAEDQRTAELGIHVTIRGEVVVLGGEVSSEERKRQLETVVREQLPQARIHNDVYVAHPSAPTDTEALGTVDTERG